MEEEYINKFIKLCTQKENYNNRYNIIKNNRNAKELLKIKDELSENKELAIKVYTKLMNIKEESILEVAAAHCLWLKINVSKAEEILNNIIENGKNPIKVLEAEMTLKTWKQRNK